MNFQPVTYIPQPGEPPVPAAPYTPAPDTRGGWLDTANTWLANTIPPWVWLAAAGTLFAALLVMRWRLAKAHRVNPPKTGNPTKKLGSLFHVSVGFAMLLWAGVLIGSGKNLIGWARDTLGWRDGWDWLVPFTLDGVAIAFAILMFAAVRAGRSASRAYRVVWTATIASAAIGFSHEYDGTTKTMFAAVYLGLLALGAMAILHELLDLFRSHTEKKAARINPVFGLRWFTYTPNTVCAWLAWQNHPPRPLPAKPSDEQIVWYGSVRHAVAHLETVRRAKRIARRNADLSRGRDTVHRWLLWIPPLRELAATLTAERAELAEMSARLDKVAADYAAEKARAEAAERAAEDANRRAQAADTARTRAEQLVAAADRRIAVAQAELTAALARLDQMEQRWIDAKQESAVSARALSAAQAEVHSARLSAERAEKEADTLRASLRDTTEKHSAELTETITRLRAEMAENEARIRAEIGTVRLSDYRSGERSKPATGRRSKTTENRSGASNQPRMTDEEAVQALLRAHPEPDYEWRQVEVQAITGAGFGRIPRLISAVAEHHRRTAADNPTARAEATGAENAERPNGEDTELARTAATVAAG